MTKEEVIKEAWNKAMPNQEYDVNGWSKNIYLYGHYQADLFDCQYHKQGAIIRPKSLQEIEHNNGC